MIAYRLNKPFPPSPKDYFRCIFPLASRPQIRH
ncbi:hypothetical protein M2368_000039 [Arthrobacter sp. JUb119]|nr:hypothetical protein [Arthrobacter sp. JUb119]